MLQNPDLLSHQYQRISIFVLLFEMYKTQPFAKNPFAPVFLEVFVSISENMPNVVFNFFLILPHLF